MSEPTYYCSLCGKPSYRDCLTVTYKDAELPKAWEICKECEASLNEWAQSRASGAEAKPTATPSSAKQCPFYGIGGECVKDCTLHINGKCSFRVIAEGMC